MQRMAMSDNRSTGLRFAAVSLKKTLSAGTRVTFRKRYRVRRLIAVASSVLTLFIGGLVIYPQSVQAVLEIDIDKGQIRGIPIAIVPFGERGVSSLPYDVAQIIEDDLSSSGRFDPISRADFLSRPTDEDIVFKDWRLIKAEALVVGFIEDRGDGLLNMQFRLMDVFGGKQIDAVRYPTRRDGLREQAHIISDRIYEALTGERGAFDTKIAYVSKRNSGDGKLESRMWVADYDGQNRQPAITVENGAILGLAYAPDRTRIAFVTQEADGSYSLNIFHTRGDRDILLESRSSVITSPAWSPDGSKLAYATSEFDGNVEIYVRDVASGQDRRLTDNPSIDLYPNFSPDGRSIAFTSNRSGKNQIYEMPVNGGRATRISTQGKENQQARYSPDGKQLVLISNQGNGENVAILDLVSKTTTVLSDTRFDESPSFAPNGKMVVYSTKSGGKRYLRVVTTDGNFNYNLDSDDPIVMEPSWSPFRPEK